MAIDINNFIWSLVRFQAAAAGVECVKPPYGLVAHRAIDGQVTDPFTVLRAYGGPSVVKHPLARYGMQWRTQGADPSISLARAQKLFETLLKPDGTPLRMKVIEAFKHGDNSPDGEWMIISAEPQRPGLVGTDDRSRELAIFNADVSFVKRT